VAPWNRARRQAAAGLHPKCAGESRAQQMGETSREVDERRCLIFPGLVRIFADQLPTRASKIKHLARKSARGLAMLSIWFLNPHEA
jgi:hypothetical protein